MTLCLSLCEGAAEMPSQEIKLRPEDFPNLLRASLKPFELCLKAAIALGSSHMMEQAAHEVGELMTNALLTFCEEYPRARTVQ